MSSQPPAFLSYKPFQYAASVVLAVMVIFFVLNPYVYHAFLVGAFFAYGLVAIVFLQVRAKTPLVDYLAVALLALIFCCVDHFGVHYAIRVRSVCSFVGLASLLVLGLRAIWTTTNRDIFNYCFLPALALTLGMGLDGYFLQHSASLRSGTMDLYLYAADCSFGIQGSYLTGQLLQRVRWLSDTSIFVYDLCIAPPVLTYAVMLHDKKRALNAFVAFAVAGPIGIILFRLVPGTGPFYTFVNFPVPPFATADVVHLVLRPVMVNAPRNAIPSLHMTWAILAFWNTRRGPEWLRVLTFVLLAGTVLATLGTGQHYLVDLIAAVPFALTVQAIASNVFGLDHAFWRRPFLCGLGMTLLWLGLVTFGVKALWVSRVLPWTLAILTLAFTAYCYAELRRNEDQLAS